MGKGCFWSVSACTSIFLGRYCKLFRYILALGICCFSLGKLPSEQSLMILALVAYFAYVVNAGQFL